MRKTLVVAVLVAATGCGSVCDQAITAERSTNQKSTSCTTTNITVHDSNKCNSNLGKCTSDDLTEIGNYANCLNGLPVCQSGNEIQWNAQRQGCINQAFFKISFACQSNIL